ncbi:hypothetical protein CJU94_14950 [Paraburkholderia aromaticivorans]|uniref:Uncharacterized protein n=1 Tax=Paraburkholderia aromaticivorans TaxID=2026199 RepID=A0A248VK24_9BURK|nr:hypothetical protein CJU94_14950 [Paraburkholderia aromaticivorans]
MADEKRHACTRRNGSQDVATVLQRGAFERAGVAKNDSSPPIKRTTHTPPPLVAMHAARMSGNGTLLAECSAR